MTVNNYICKRTNIPIMVDGILNKEIWQRALKSPRFIDVIGGTPALYESRVALLWDDEYLYIGFWCKDPYPNATITKRDAHLWYENDVEVFIDGGDSYYEFQINAINTIYEVFYIWQDAYKKGGKFDIPIFDILDNKALSFGGNHDRSDGYFWKGSHPRGNRWAFFNWDLPGLKTATHVNGYLNNTTKASEGWTAELAIPWDGMKYLANGRSLPPKDNDVWKMFLGRYQKLSINGQDTSVGWAFDKIGTNDNHYPEKFTNIIFSYEYV